MKITQDSFIQKSIDTHSGKYDYSLVQYINLSEKIQIICLEHGIFAQQPKKHLSGQGCPRCARLKQSSWLVHDSTTVIKNFIKIHGNKYNYSLVVYRRNKHKVKIICLKHGVFEQTPNSHINGSGCPKCSYENKTFDYIKKYTLNKSLGAKPGIFYKLKFEHKSGFKFLKVGITSKTIKQRYGRGIYKDFTYEIIEMIECSNLESARMEKEFMRTTKLKKFKFPPDISFKGVNECYEIRGSGN